MKVATKIGIITIALLILIIALSIYLILDPTVYGSIFPQCKFYEITGFQCPGCGSQRALHSLLNGNVLEAIKFNLIFVVMVPYFAIYLIERSVYWLKDEPIKASITDSKFLNKWFFSFFIAFSVLRNSPQIYDFFLSHVS